MTKIIETDISVTEIPLLKAFLEANKLSSIQITYYGKPTGLQYCISNCISLLVPDDETLTDNEKHSIMYMSLKYGSIVMAFEHFLTITQQIKLHSANLF